MRTGQDCLELGLYVSSCCESDLIFDRDDCFSRCPHCEGLCDWELIERLASWDAMEDISETAAA